ncbi:hypothetical protein RI054_01g06560 [Pseudoscourfieldia marina]
MVNVDDDTDNSVVVTTSTSMIDMAVAHAHAHQLNRQKQAADDVDFGTMTIVVLAMALFAGLGVLPLYVAKVDATWEGPGLAVACGMMLAASFDLLEDGSNGNALGTTLPYLGNAGSHKVALLVGALLGIATMGSVKRFFSGSGDDGDDDDDDAARQIVKALNAAGMGNTKDDLCQGPGQREELSKAKQVQCLLYLLVCLCIHSGEGISMGVAFKAERGWQQGVRVAFSMGLHNACEGLAIALVLTSSGFSNAAGAFWTNPGASNVDPIVDAVVKRTLEETKDAVVTAETTSTHAGSSGDAAAAAAAYSAAAAYTCPICYEVLPKEDIFHIFRCDHTMCRMCGAHAKCE